MFFDEKANQGVFEEKQKQLKDMTVSYHAYASKTHRKNIKKSTICEFVSKRAALLVLSGFILLKMFSSIHSWKKLGSIVSHEVLFK